MYRLYIEVENRRRQVNFTHAYNATGTYLLDVHAYNAHSEKPDGLKRYRHNDTVNVVVEMPVANWTVTASSYWVVDYGGDFAMP